MTAYRLASQVFQSRASLCKLAFRACNRRPDRLPMSLPCSSQSFNGREGGYKAIYSTATGDAGTAFIQPEKPEKLRSRFCRMCGGPIEFGIPEGEKEWRHVCHGCGYVDYYNPKMVVGCIVEHEGRVLLCRRGIDPCKGAWTLPAGYMEIGESSVEGAVRETWEEANCRVQVLAPYVHFDIPIIGQAYVLFRASLLPPFSYSPGEETLETALVHPDDIPWSELAFSSISMALKYYVEDLKSGHFRVHHGTIHKGPGAAPNAPGTFVVKDHYAIETVVEVDPQSRL